MKVPLAGGTPTTLAAGADVVDLAVGSTSIYWTDGTTDAVMKAPK